MNTDNKLAIRDEIPLTDLGTILAKSGFFQDTRDAAQAIVKVLAGRELGFGPIASMTGFQIIKGRVSMSANLMGAAVKGSGRYNYRVIELTEEVCEIAFFENGQEIGRSRFTLKDARSAGTQNLDKFPRNMLFARAMSNGVKWYCPDVMNGQSVYTPDELGEAVDENGEIVREMATVIDHGPVTSGTAPKPAAKPNGGNDAVLLPDSKAWDAWHALRDRAEKAGLVPDEPPAGCTVGQLREHYKALRDATELMEAGRNQEWELDILAVGRQGNRSDGGRRRATIPHPDGEGHERTVF